MSNRLNHLEIALDVIWMRFSWVLFIIDKIKTKGNDVTAVNVFLRKLKGFLRKKE